MTMWREFSEVREQDLRKIILLAQEEIHLEGCLFGDALRALAWFGRNQIHGQRINELYILWIDGVLKWASAEHLYTTGHLLAAKLLLSDAQGSIKTAIIQARGNEAGNDLSPLEQLDRLLESRACYLAAVVMVKDQDVLDANRPNLSAKYQVAIELFEKAMDLDPSRAKDYASSAMSAKVLAKLSSGRKMFIDAVDDLAQGDIDPARFDAVVRELEPFKNVRDVKLLIGSARVLCAIVETVSKLRDGENLELSTAFLYGLETERPHCDSVIYGVVDQILSIFVGAPGDVEYTHLNEQLARTICSMSKFGLKLHYDKVRELVDLFNNNCRNETTEDRKTDKTKSFVTSLESELRSEDNNLLLLQGMLGIAGAITVSEQTREEVESVSCNASSLRAVALAEGDRLKLARIESTDDMAIFLLLSECECLLESATNLRDHAFYAWPIQDFTKMVKSMVRSSTAKLALATVDKLLALEDFNRALPLLNDARAKILAEEGDGDQLRPVILLHLDLKTLKALAGQAHREAITVKNEDPIKARGLFEQEVTVLRKIFPVITAMTENGIFDDDEFRELQQETLAAVNLASALAEGRVPNVNGDVAVALGSRFDVRYIS